MAKYVIEISVEQAEFIKKAIDSYEYVTSDVMSCDEVQSRRINIILPIYDQLPKEVF